MAEPDSSCVLSAVCARADETSAAASDSCPSAVPSWPDAAPNLRWPAEAAAAAAAAAAEAPTGGADIMDINAEKSMELRKTVRQFAQNNPEIAAQLVKAWLKGDENNG